FVSAVHKCTRSTDKIIRWGGDEFIVILQNVSMELLPAIGDKILESIRSIKLEALPGDVKITSSMGFAFFREEDDAYKDTLARADEALYRAKNAGRNNWKV
ncbi:MAG: GGDEF domain-containing protein, partial [Lachnospiraceae bacterium]|nr:GGDEF domain-containing protein [Lachnospiraceae bacterium]MBP5703055.1 GGDEF domain-containing protein [Lachnospiraceae bacterium]